MFIITVIVQNCINNSLTLSLKIKYSYILIRLTLILKNHRYHKINL